MCCGSGLLEVYPSPCRQRLTSHPPPPAPSPHSTEAVAGFGYNLQSTGATPSPTTVAERSEQSGIDANGGGSDGKDTSWWVAAAVGAGVGLGIVVLGGLLISRFGKKRTAVAKPSAVNAGDGGETANETKAEPA